MCKKIFRHTASTKNKKTEFVNLVVVDITNTDSNSKYNSNLEQFSIREKVVWENIICEGKSCNGEQNL